MKSDWFFHQSLSYLLSPKNWNLLISISYWNGNEFWERSEQARIFIAIQETEFERDTPSLNGDLTSRRNEAYWETRENDSAAILRREGRVLSRDHACGSESEFVRYCGTLHVIPLSVARRSNCIQTANADDECGRRRTIIDWKAARLLFGWIECATGKLVTTARYCKSRAN